MRFEEQGQSCLCWLPVFCFRYSWNFHKIGSRAVKKPDKGVVCSHWIHTSDSSFARPQKDTAYSVF